VHKHGIVVLSDHIFLNLLLVVIGKESGYGSVNLILCYLLYTATSGSVRAVRWADNKKVTKYCYKIFHVG